MGLITFNGQLLLKGGALASSKNCCCVSYTCYCFTSTVDYQASSRWRKCYRASVYDPVLDQFVFPDGQPCDGSANGSICPPGAAGRFVIMEGAAVKTCGCGGDPPGTGYNAARIENTPEAFSNCSDIGSPP